MPVIAVETGPEPLKTLRGFVDACGKGMGINFDPANLVMVGADDEVSAVADAGSAIVHTPCQGRPLPEPYPSGGVLPQICRGRPGLDSLQPLL